MTMSLTGSRGKTSGISAFGSFSSSSSGLDGEDNCSGDELLSSEGDSWVSVDGDDSLARSDLEEKASGETPLLFS